MNTRREFLGTLSGIAAASFIPFEIAWPQPFDVDTMGTWAYPLSTPLTELWSNQVRDSDELKNIDAQRLTQMVVDYLQRESIDAYLVNYPATLINGEPRVVRPRKLKPAYMPNNDDMLSKNLGFDAGRIIKGHADDGLSVGIMLVECTPIANPMDVDENFVYRRGIIMRYLTSKTPADEILRLAKLTKKSKEPARSYRWYSA